MIKDALKFTKVRLQSSHLEEVVVVASHTSPEQHSSKFDLQ